MEEKDVIEFENMMFNGVLFPESGVRVYGYKLDNPTIHARLTEAPYWVQEMDRRSLFERWGTPVRCE